MNFYARPSFCPQEGAGERERDGGMRAGEDAQRQHGKKGGKGRVPPASSAGKDKQ